LKIIITFYVNLNISFDIEIQIFSHVLNSSYKFTCHRFRKYFWSEFGVDKYISSFKITTSNVIRKFSFKYNIFRHEFYLFIFKFYYINPFRLQYL